MESKPVFICNLHTLAAEKKYQSNTLLGQGKERSQTSTGTFPQEYWWLICTGQNCRYWQFLEGKATNCSRSAAFLQVGGVFSGLLPSSWGTSLITSQFFSASFSSLKHSTDTSHMTCHVPTVLVGPEVHRKLVPLEESHTEWSEKH